MSKSSEPARTAMRAWRSALRNFCVAAAISACVHCRASHPTPQTARCPRIPQASTPVNLHRKIFSHAQKRRNRSIPRQSTLSRLRLPRRSLRPRLLNLQTRKQTMIAKNLRCLQNLTAKRNRPSQRNRRRRSPQPHQSHRSHVNRRRAAVEFSGLWE